MELRDKMEYDTAFLNYYFFNCWRTSPALQLFIFRFYLLVFWLIARCFVRMYVCVQVSSGQKKAPNPLGMEFPGAAISLVHSMLLFMTLSVAVKVVKKEL